MSTQPPGPQFWRTLEERFDDPAFRAAMEREFPDDAAEWADPVSRRRFLRLAGASLALAGLAGAGCSQAPSEKIVPYVRQPEGLVPGKPLYYATAMPLAGSAIGLLVESHEGRPTKIEGNPQHPMSLGATDAIAQAAILELWGPDRSQAVTYRARSRSWGDLVSELQKQYRELKKTEGRGLRVLTEAVCSPTLLGQLDRLLTDLPQAVCVEYEPCGPDTARLGAQASFDRKDDAPRLDAQYDFSKADVIVALDADFLGGGPARLRSTDQHASRRRARDDGAVDLNRLYAVEPTPSITGLCADNRLALRPAEVAVFARHLARALGVDGVPETPSLSDRAMEWVKAVAADLQGRPKGRTVVVAGDGQPPEAHALAHAINAHLGNVGSTVWFVEAPQADETVLPRRRSGTSALRGLVEEMQKGEVSLLLILGGNPVYTAPPELRFAEALMAKDEEGNDKVKLRVRLGLYEDETSRLCHWQVPETHFLETWSDARAADGTCTVMQPLIAPLYQGRSAHELLSAFRGEPAGKDVPALLNAYDLVRAHWRRWWEQRGGSDGVFEAFWQRSLHAGFVEGTTQRAVKVEPRADWAARAGLKAGGPGSSKSFDVVFRPDPALFDGRFAANAWLQEMPKPVTKLTWGNAALISPKTARDLGVEQRFGWHGGQNGELITEMLELTFRGRSVQAPAFILPGQTDGVVTLHLGHGREVAGDVGTGVGFDAYRLREGGLHFADGLEVKKTDERFTLACVQATQTMATSGFADVTGPRGVGVAGHAFSRGIVRAGTAAEYARDRRAPAREPHEAPGEKFGEEEGPRAGKKLPLTLFAQREPEGPYQWGMTIDLGACTGCGACVVACQAENNIPVVGKEQVTRARHMHWIRIDRYFTGEPDDPRRAVNQPVPCMQCENAPCELVCPVEATSHSVDGLNDMTYNRCVGTRYCSNNCPYKVRRFNFLQFADYATESLKGMRNPEVTVRSRGVMEKCTYCVQRIRAAEIDAKNQRREVRDGEVVTACQGACPAEAIVFGNVFGEAPDTAVKRRKALPLNYEVLAELGTRPRTSYLAALSNPNPALEGA
jgi:molybdopterin-containing oxidoreductase family iron-sulfur binding subunit